MPEEMLSTAEAAPPLSASARLKNHLKRRFLLGIAVFLPFGLTLWILLEFVTFSKDALTKPLDTLLRKTLSEETLESMVVENTDQFQWYLEYSLIGASVLVALLVLYLVGTISATIIGRRYITFVEDKLKRIPGMQFCYSTIKQVVEIISMPRSQAFQKTVVIEYPRKGIRGLAFFSGITTLPETGEIMINVFIPTTPNPTSGFLLLMRPEEVLETNLTVSEATRFIISGGVVALDNLQLIPFPVEDYQGAFSERRHDKNDDVEKEESVYTGEERRAGKEADEQAEKTVALDK